MVIINPTSKTTENEEKHVCSLPKHVVAPLLDGEGAKHKTPLPEALLEEQKREQWYNLMYPNQDKKGKVQRGDSGGTYRSHPIWSSHY